MTEPDTAARRPPGAGEAAGPVSLRGASLWLAGMATGLGLLVVASGPALYRLRLLPLDAATGGVASASVWFFLIGGLTAVFAVMAAGAARNSRQVILAIVFGTAAMLAGFRAYGFQLSRSDLPPLWDVQTDWTAPVAFSARVLRERAGERAATVRDDARLPDGPGRWSGQAFAVAQEDVYGLKPLLLSVGVADANAAVAEAARRMRWAVRPADPDGAGLEAVHRSVWYGLASDIAVRVRPAGGGSRIDVRSTSRVAGPDMGANARRVEALLADVAFSLRGEGAQSRAE